MKKFLAIAGLIIVVGVIVLLPNGEGPDAKQLGSVAKESAVVPQVKLEEGKSWYGYDLSLTQVKELPPKELLSPKVAFIVGLSDEEAVSLDPAEKKRDLIRRDQETFKVDASKLTWEDQQALYAFLEQQPDDLDDHLFFHSLKNDVLLLLMRSKKNPQQLGQKMNDMVLDDNQHHVWREYTVQFIPDFVDRELSSVDLSPEKEELFKDLTETMWKMTEETRGSLPGTALMKLNDLSQDFTSIDRQKIRETALSIASNDQVDSASRMGALRVMTENKWDDQLKGIQQIALDDQVPVTLRMSAIHSAIKLNADEAFKAQLKEKILDAEKSDKRLKYVVEQIK